MRAAASTTPQIDALRLGKLTDVSGSDLQSEDSREGERLLEADLSSADLRHLVLSECEWVEPRLTGADLTGARILETRILRADAATLTAPRSTWHDVHLEHSRIGSADLYDTEWRAVRFADCKLGYLNLRGAKLQDIVFENCTIDELDLQGASVRRLAFADTTVTTLDVTRATLLDADLRGLEMRAINGYESLRGATITPLQLQELAPLLAEQLGITVRD